MLRGFSTAFSTAYARDVIAAIVSAPSGGRYEPPRRKTRKELRDEAKALDRERELEYVARETAFRNAERESAEAAEAAAALEAEKAIVRARLDAARKVKADARLLAELTVYEALLTEQLVILGEREGEEAAALLLLVMSM